MGHRKHGGGKLLKPDVADRQVTQPGEQTQKTFDLLRAVVALQLQQRNTAETRAQLRQRALQRDRQAEPMAIARGRFEVIVDLGFAAPGPLDFVGPQTAITSCVVVFLGTQRGACLWVQTRCTSHPTRQVVGHPQVFGLQRKQGGQRATGLAFEALHQLADLRGGQRRQQVMGKLFSGHHAVFVQPQRGDRAVTRIAATQAHELWVVLRFLRGVGVE